MSARKQSTYKKELLEKNINKELIIVGGLKTLLLLFRLYYHIKEYMFVLFVILTFLYMFLHSFLADTRVKNYFYKNIISERYYRFFFVSYSVLFLIPIAYIYITGDKYNCFQPKILSDLLGWMLILISFYMFFISFKNYNIREFLGLDRLKSEKKVFYPLKVSGINKIVRHPLYSFSYTLMLGLFLIAPNNYILVASIITAVYLPIGIYFEEKKLLKEYGKKYKDYMERVPKLIPSILRKKIN